MTEALLRAAEARAPARPGCARPIPDVPAALEAVVRRCLAPEPDDRYASAAQLAADLQAVADDAPLRFAREPIPGRCVRWVRRNRRRLAIAAPFVLALGLSACLLVYSQLAAMRLEAEVRHWLDEAQHSAEGGQLELALSHFDTAERLALGDAGRLSGLLDRIRQEHRLASETKEIRDKTDGLFRVGERLRFSLLGFEGDGRTACKQVQSALAQFSIPDDPAWFGQESIGLLDRPRRDRMIGEVNELLFLWVFAMDREWHGDPAAARQAIRICDVALASAPTVGPWRAMRARCAAILAGEPPPSRVPPRAEGETSARGCFQWALLCHLEERPESAVAWLERATLLKPSDYWSQFYLGNYYELLGRDGRAMEHYQAAVALRPDSPWARFNRSVIYRKRGDWEQALNDLNRALTSAGETDFLGARLNLGLVRQALGDDPGARAAYESVIAAAGPGNSLARAGRLNRATIDIDAGAVDRAWAEYAALLAENPRDDQALLARALLALRLGRAAQAERDLTALLLLAPERADQILARRALARLTLGRLEGAEEDAAGAYRRRPSPSRERLWVRTLLALRRADELSWLNRPDDLTLLPGGGPSLKTDLRATAERLRFAVVGGRGGASSARIHRTRAVLLCALNDPTAEAEASRAIELTPESAEAYLVRARIRRIAGNRAAALADVESALTLVPGDPRLLELRGILKTETGNPEGGPHRPGPRHPPRCPGDGPDAAGAGLDGPGAGRSRRPGLVACAGRRSRRPRGLPGTRPGTDPARIPPTRPGRPGTGRRLGRGSSDVVAEDHGRLRALPRFTTGSIPALDEARSTDLGRMDGGCQTQTGLTGRGTDPCPWMKDYRGGRPEDDESSRGDADPRGRSFLRESGPPSASSREVR